MFKAVFLSLMLIFTAVSCTNSANVVKEPEFTYKKIPYNKKCKSVGKFSNKNVILLVSRDCGDVQGTIVTFIILKKPYMKAIEDGTTAMLKILGFKPKLMPLLSGTVPLKGTKKRVIMVSYLVTGPADG